MAEWKYRFVLDKIMSYLYSSHKMLISWIPPQLESMFP